MNPHDLAKRCCPDHAAEILQDAPGGGASESAQGTLGGSNREFLLVLQSAGVFAARRPRAGRLAPAQGAPHA